MQTSSKTIVITGASSGIGLACCQSALTSGHKVIATARKPADLAKLQQLGAHPVELELNNENSVEQAAKRIIELSQGHIDVLFNNAGYGLQVAMEDTEWQALQQQMTSNVIGPIILSNHLLPHIPKGGKLIFNGSILGLITIPFRGPYCMSKYALEAATDAYRLELASMGVDVHIIEPGPIDASFRKNALKAINACLNNKKTRIDYSEHIDRLSHNGLSKGTLPATAVADIFDGIINGKNTKPRYLVTSTAKVAAILKRVMGSQFHLIARNNPCIKLNNDKTH